MRISSKQRKSRTLKLNLSTFDFRKKELDMRIGKPLWMIRKLMKKQPAIRARAVRARGNQSKRKQACSRASERATKKPLQYWNGQAYDIFILNFLFVQLKIPFFLLFFLYLVQKADDIVLTFQYHL